MVINGICEIIFTHAGEEITWRFGRSYTNIQLCRQFCNLEETAVIKIKT